MNPYLGLTQLEICEINDALILDGGWTEDEDDLLWDAQFAATTDEEWAWMAASIKNGRKRSLPAQ